LRILFPLAALKRFAPGAKVRMNSNKGKPLKIEWLIHLTNSPKLAGTMLWLCEMRWRLPAAAVR
jgi:hypothetical protein